MHCTAPRPRPCLPACLAVHPVQEGEQTWLLAGQLGSAGLQGSADVEVLAGAVQHDVPPEQLADEDSHFLDDCQGLRVHYKLALPQVQPGSSLGWAGVAETAATYIYGISSLPQG